MRRIIRRDFLKIAGAASGLAFAGDFSPSLAAEPRQRVIIDNDFAADPDGLYQTAHHLLCSSVDVRMLIGSHSHAGESWGGASITTAKHAAKAREVLQLAVPGRDIPVLAGLDGALPPSGAPVRAASAEAIIAEAMRSVDGAPLYYAAGAGLTELANAWLLEPEIGRKIRLLWIGGSEYPGAIRPPGPIEAEYNLTIDVSAAQIVFNRSNIDIWQVPRSTYRQMLIGWAELEERSRALGALGNYLADRIAEVRRAIASAAPPIGPNPGETYVLGDSPLVTLTALQSVFQPDPSSSTYELRKRPLIDDKGRYAAYIAGNGKIRVYTHIDQRLTFEDMFAKFRLSAGQRAN